MATERSTRRAYHSPRRAEQAEETRAAILAAARTLFADRGYGDVTINAIAEAAGVSPQTIYVAFGSKAAILSALVRSVGTQPATRALAAKTLTEPDPRRQLELMAAVLRAIREVDSDVLRLLWQAGDAEPAVVAAWSDVNKTRWERVSAIAASLAANGALRHGVTKTSAAEELWTLSSPEVWRLLVEERGWSMKRWEQWLATTLTRLLLKDTKARPASRGRSGDR